MMNDRFKFRAWDKQNNCMVDGDYYDVSFSGVLCYEEHGDYEMSLRPVEKDNYVLMQCTGLKDKNGQLIFDGDIYEYPHGTEEDFEMRRGVVTYSEGVCSIGFQLLTNCKNLTVIGNIHQHPELLETNND